MLRNAHRCRDRGKPRPEACIPCTIRCYRPGEADSELRIYYSFKATFSERVVVDMVQETGAANYRSPLLGG
jgi:hypothetical protein